jgi:hypothetical protein
VEEKTWKEDEGLLLDLIENDEAVKNCLKESWDDIARRDPESGAISEVEIDYSKLAREKELIQKALKNKDWTKSTALAARILELNPAEARILAASDKKQAKQVLWDEYSPSQVWFYLGGIGLLGTIGMVIFYIMTKGQRREEEEVDLQEEES